MLSSVFFNNSSFPLFAEVSPPFVRQRRRRYLDPFDIMERDLSCARSFNAFNAFAAAPVALMYASCDSDSESEHEHEPQQQTTPVEQPTATAQDAGNQQAPVQPMELVADTKHNNDTTPSETPREQQQEQETQVAAHKPLPFFDWFNTSGGALTVVPREKSYDISVDVPGIPKEQLKVQVHDHPSGRKVLRVFGERKHEAANSFSVSTVSRSVILPSDIDPAASLSATYENGVLKLAVPKTEKVAPSNIDVPIV
jgi:HSP20 family molecular chaperone IbpA